MRLIFFLRFKRQVCGQPAQKPTITWMGPGSEPAADPGTSSLAGLLVQSKLVGIQCGPSCHMIP
jgi:hypothetical protein